MQRAPTIQSAPAGQGRCEIVVRAEIVGDDTCTVGNITVRAAAPTLAMCRRLVADGFDPGRTLHAYRGDVLCLTVRSIGAAAKLTVKERPFGPVFEAWLPFSAPPVSSQIARQESAATCTSAGGAP